MKVLLSMLLLISSSLASANYTDPCVGDQVIHNRWFIEINYADEATREGLLKTLDLLSTGGFSVKYIFSSSQSPTKSIVVSFNPSYWVAGAEVADRIKLKTLHQLEEIEGNLILCDYLTSPDFDAK